MNRASSYQLDTASSYQQKRACLFFNLKDMLFSYSDYPLFGMEIRGRPITVLSLPDILRRSDTLP